MLALLALQFPVTSISSGPVAVSNSQALCAFNVVTYKQLCARRLVRHVIATLSNCGG